jgi:hypothetical protein
MKDTQTEAGLASDLNRELGLYLKEMMAFRKKKDFRLDDVLSELKKAYYAIRKGENYNWQGYDITHAEIRATQPSAKEWLEKAQWWHDSKNMPYLDQILLLGVLIGMNHGIDKGVIDGKIEAIRSATRT